MRIRLLSLLLAAVTGVAAAAPDAVDLLLMNGRIHTMDARFSSAQAMAIRDGRIVAIGSDQQLRALRQHAAKIVDLKGQAVIPGLIDTHTHALSWALGVVERDIDTTYPKMKSIADIAAAVKARASELTAGKPIAGAGWDESKLSEHRTPTRADLDAASPNNPVILGHISGHSVWVNSAALRMAGITTATPNPDGGIIDKNAAGELTGILKENAQGLVAALNPPPNKEKYVEAIAYLSDAAAEVGLTTIHNISLAPDEINAYYEARRRGKLQIRVHMSPVIGSYGDVARIRSMGVATGFGDDMLKFGPLKIFTDGGRGPRTIAIYPPPVVGEPANLGVLMWKSDELEKSQQELTAMGWQLATHAIGDRAIDQVLASYAKIIHAHPGKDLRPRVIHCGIATPAIQKRLKELKVVVDNNPPFIYWLDSYGDLYGEERVRWSYPGKSYFENGIVAAGGSDVPVSPLSPWWGIWAAVVRRELKSGKIMAPEERVTVEQALTMYTRNGAYVAFEEDRKGSLEPGKLGDFLVLDRDVFTVPAEELKDVKVRQTYVGGKQIYARH